MQEFNAKAVLLERTGEGIWSYRDVLIRTREDIINMFEGATSDDIVQTDINGFEKAYTATNKLSASGIYAKIQKDDGTIDFACSSILFVLCDREKPIDISQTFREKIRVIVDLY